MKYKLLDLFCCQGGASKGYATSGIFDIVGVDIKIQPRYPFQFIQGEALQYITDHGKDFDFIHASPPCQFYTKAKKLRGREHLDLIALTRKRLNKTGKPWVIENVVGSPLIKPIELCGMMFGINTFRHRLFESNFDLIAPYHPIHKSVSVKMGRPVCDGEYIHIVGNFSNVAYGRKVMGMEWANRYGLAQAVPPVYTEWIAKKITKKVLNKKYILNNAKVPTLNQP